MRAFQGREAEKYGSIYQRPGQQEKGVRREGAWGWEEGWGCQGHLRELSGDTDL